MPRTRRLAPAASLIALLPLLAPVCAAAADGQAEDLTPAQRQTVASAIAALHTAADRHVASEWSDAKKVAETMCRPLALERLRHRDHSIDRVFLGDASAESLTLQGNTRLRGSGQARAGSDWKPFTFTCELDPRSGRASAFDVKWDRPG